MKPTSLTRTIAVLLLPAHILAAVNGRCSGRWNDGLCICLDRNDCFQKYPGSVIQGSPGDWPCPNDPDNIWGCRIYRCPTMHMATDCRWKEACVGGRPITNPVCPGGNDFICCQYD